MQSSKQQLFFKQYLPVGLHNGDQLTSLYKGKVIPLQAQFGPEGG